MIKGMRKEGKKRRKKKTRGKKEKKSIRERIMTKSDTWGEKCHFGKRGGGKYYWGNIYPCY